MTNKYNRPAGAFPGAPGLTQRTKYQDDAAAVPKRAISSSKIDGDFNYLIDGLNETWEALQAASFASALPAQTGNAGKVPVTNGTTTSWQLITGVNVSDETLGLAKLSNLGSYKIVASGASGVPQAVGLGDGLSMVGSVLKAALPAGMVLPFAANVIPSGWLLCSGTAVSRTGYGDLFAAIGTTFGAGDGNTTFNLPDLRGRSIFGRDDMGGADAGRLNISNVLGTGAGAQLKNFSTNGTVLTVGQLPSHSHGQNIGGSKQTNSGGTGVSVSGLGSTATSSNNNQTLTDVTGNNEAHSHSVSNVDILPPLLILNWLIKT